MKYLLDVNALIALGLKQHQFHTRMDSWPASLSVGGIPQLATYSISELGFVRVVSQAPAYGVTFLQARTLLLRLKKSKTYNFDLIPDDHDVTRMPSWVKSGKQTTDGHLSELAKSNGAILATLDQKIPGSFLIP